MSSSLKNIHLTYCAYFKDASGRTGETVQTAARTAGELFRELSLKYTFRLSEHSCRVGINDAFSSWQTELRGDDHVVFIPPVSGG